MKFFETSKYYTLKKSTYISLRWIGIIGQLFSVYFVFFFLNFDFNFIISNLVIFVGILSNLYLVFIYHELHKLLSLKYSLFEAYPTKQIYILRSI